MQSAVCKTLVVALALAIQVGCGSSKKDPEPPPPPAGATSGIAVDPYLVGAVFQEVTPGGGVVQTSSASTATGAFTFPAKLTIGNQVRLSVGGQHNGVPYTVTLKRDVDVAETTLVVSPLTTLVAGGAMTPAAAVALINSAVGASLTEADLFADPMARMLDGSVSDADRKLLAANIAAGAALQVLGAGAAQADVAAVVSAVAPKLLAALAVEAAPQAVASAAAAIAEYVAQTADTASEITAAVANVSPALVTQLVQAASTGANAAIVVSDGGTPVAGTVSGTIAEHLQKGKAALEAGLVNGSTDKLLEAANRFSAAAALLGVDTTASEADGDRARFYGGVARVLLLAQPYSDLTDDGLQDLGDLLDGFGLGGTAAQRANLDTFEMETCETIDYGYGYSYEECRLKDLSPTSPTSGELQTFLFNQIRAALLGAVELLDGVGAGFADQVNDSGTTVQLDRTDALVFKSVASAMLAKIHLQRGYDLGVDIDALVNEGVDDVSAFLDLYQSFLTLKDAEALPDARVHALAAIDAFQAALESLEAEADDQSNDLVVFYDYDCDAYYSCTATYNAPETLAEIEDVLAKAEAALRAEGNHSLALGTAEEPFDVVVNPSRLFTGIDLRAVLPEVWNAGAFGDSPGPFQDATLGGFLVSGIDLDEDVDGDGSPDLWDGYTYFPPGYFAGNTFTTWSWPLPLGENTWTNGAIELSFDATLPRFVLAMQLQTCGTDPITFQYACTASFESYPGGYSQTQNALTLTFDEAGPSGVKTAIYTAEEIDDGSFQGVGAYWDAGGAALVPQYGSWMSWYRPWM